MPSVYHITYTNDARLSFAISKLAIKRGSKIGHMNKILLFSATICCFLASCTKDKTDYEAEINTVVTEHIEYKEALLVNNESYTISIETLNGTFYKGYNEIRLRITNTQTKEAIQPDEVTFLPILTGSNDEKYSSPHRYMLKYIAEEKYYAGYAVFTGDRLKNETWKLYLGYTIGTKKYNFSTEIPVAAQTNKNLNMTSFIGTDSTQYYIALVSPQKPKIAENPLVAGIYKRNKTTHTSKDSLPDPREFSFSEAEGYTLLLDPRMPEPSMGNHSSINNKDLTQQSDGLYHGVVNYTMTGNWTLNFILLNKNKKIIKGTEVPTDFTPGIDGARSELHIDILF